MADKDYNVKLQLQIGDSLGSIQSLLDKVTTLKSAVTDLDESELALNVVVRNLGFQNAIANINKTLMKMANESEKAGAKVGDSISKGIDDSAKKTKQKNPYKAVAKDIAKDTKAELEGTLKGLETSIKDTSDKIKKTLEDSFKNLSGEALSNNVAEAVSKGMIAATKRFSSVGLLHFNEQTDNFKDLTKSFSSYNEDMDKLAEEMFGYLGEMRNMFEKLSKESFKIMQTVAKEKARAEVEAEWSENHISKKDKKAAESAARKDKTDKYRAETERMDVQNQHEINLLKEKRELEKDIEDTKLKQLRTTKEIARKDKESNSAIKKNNAQQKLAEKQTEEVARKAAQEAEHQARVKARMQEQIAYRQQAREKESQRNKLYETNLEKALYNYEVAKNRILSQNRSIMDGARVSAAAIANAEKQRRDSEIEIGQELAKQAMNYDKIREKAETLGKTFREISNILTRASSAVSAVGGILSGLRAVSTSFSSMLMRAGSTFLGYARQASNTLANSALEQYRELQVAQIGFENFFGKDIAKNLIKQIREEAMKAPGVDAGDLASYVRQIAPVSNGNSQLAMDAAMGMIKTIQYGGAEASEEMEYVIKNIRDVISKGTATAIDLRQFNRAMPILEEVLKSIGASDFIKNNTLKIDKTNAKELLNAFAEINNSPDSPVTNIFNQMQHTLAGITDILKQTFITRFNETLENLGFYDKLQATLEKIYNSDAIEKFYTFLAETANEILGFLQEQDWESIGQGVKDGAKAIWDAIKEVAGLLKEVAGESDLGQLAKQAMELIANFVKGFGEGAKMFIETIKWAEKNIDKDILTKAAGLFGTLASPIGKLALVIVSIVQNLLRAAGMISQLVSTGILHHLTIMGNSVAYQIKDAANAEVIATMGKNATVREMSDTAGTLYNRGASLAKRKIAMYNPDMGTMAVMNNDGTWTTQGGIESLSSKERDALLAKNNLPTGKMAAFKTTASKVMAGIRANLGKVMSSLAWYSVGAVVSQVAGQIAQRATGSADLGASVSGLGDALSAGIAVGAQFGLLPGAIAAGISAIKTVITSINQVRKTQDEYAKHLKEQMTDTPTREMRATLITQLSEAGLYEARNRADETAKTAAYDFIAKGIKEGWNPNDLMKEATEEYIRVRAMTHAKEQYNMWTEAYKAEGVDFTAIDANANAAKIWDVYNKLVQLEFANPTTTKKINSKGEMVDYTPAEVLNYLATQHWNIDSNEGLDALLAQLNERLKQIDLEKQVDFVIKPVIVGKDKEYGDFKELFADNFILYENQWTTRAEIITYLTAKGERSKAILDAVQAASDQTTLHLGIEVDANGKKAAEKILNSRNQPPYAPQPKSGNDYGVFGSLLGGRDSNGGLIPIYRASGGGIRGVDTVPAMLQPGEFVVRKSAVSKLGTGVLTALNLGDLSKASQLLGAKVSNSWNNARSYVHNANRTYKTVYNRVSINNRTNSGRVSTYNNLANRLATGV